MPCKAAYDHMVVIANVSATYQDRMRGLYPHGYTSP